MKIHNFNGTQCSFMLSDDEHDYEVEYCDYTIHNEEVKIHEVVTDAPIEVTDLEILMFDNIDWDAVKSEAWDDRQCWMDSYFKEREL
jgi:hypothetical protein